MNRRDFLKIAGASATGAAAGASGVAAAEELYRIPNLVSRYESEISGLKEELAKSKQLPEPPEPDLINTEYLVGAYMMTRWGLHEKTRSHDWNYGLSLHPIFEYKADNPVHNEWLIYLASLYGINTFIVDLHTANPSGQPSTEDSYIGFENGLMKARYFQKMKIAIEFGNMMYWPNNQWGFDSSLLQSKTEEAIDYIVKEGYFGLPNILRIGKKPLFFFNSLAAYQQQFGTEACGKVIDMLRNILEKNGVDVFLVGDMADYAEETETTRKVDGVGGYYTNSWGLMVAEEQGKLFKGKNSDGTTTYRAPYNALVEGAIRSHKFWKGECDKEGKTFIPSMSATGFSNKIAYEEGIDKWGMLEFYSPSPEEFKLLCESAKERADPKLKMVTVVGNDYVEGAVGAELTIEYGDSFLGSLREMFVEGGKVPYHFSFLPIKK